MPKKRAVKPEKGFNTKLKDAEKELQKEVLLNVPNSLTFLRLILGFVLIYMILFTEAYLLIIFIFAIAAITDFFDGFFARRLNQKTKIGAKLDQVIDRIFMIPLVILLIIKFYQNDHNLAYLAILCLSREIIGFPGVLIRLVRKSSPYKVKLVGKITTFIQSFAIGGILLVIVVPQLIIALWILVIITFLVGIVAGFDYLRDSIK
ncbi:MAG: CDP-alcohol phosphatidyltransferase family protein [Candidatus Pacearchaeota archaeon]|jgi:CDP-diacylglycerol--glycerol-3-phosphate 3-phosphatidyltransferase